MPLMQELLRCEHEGKFTGAQKLWFRKSEPEEELYDLENDPYGFNNLAGDSTYHDKLIELRAALAAWVQATNAREDCRMTRLCGTVERLYSQFRNALRVEPVVDRGNRIWAGHSFCTLTILLLIPANSCIIILYTHIRG